MGFDITEVIVDEDALESLRTAAAACGLQFSLELNARLPAGLESPADAKTRFVARVNSEIARVSSQPRLRSLADFLVAYRDGDSNMPDMPQSASLGYLAAFITGP